MKDKILRFFFGYDDPINVYERSPFLSWLFLGGIILYAIYGTIIILF